MDWLGLIYCALSFLGSYVIMLIYSLLLTNGLFLDLTSHGNCTNQSKGQYRCPLQVWDVALLFEMKHGAIR